MHPFVFWGYCLTKPGAYHLRLRRVEQMVEVDTITQSQLY